MDVIASRVRETGPIRHHSAGVERLGFYGLSGRLTPRGGGGGTKGLARPLASYPCHIAHMPSGKAGMLVRFNRCALMSELGGKRTLGIWGKIGRRMISLGALRPNLADLKSSSIGITPPARQTSELIEATTELVKSGWSRLRSIFARARVRWASPSSR